MKKSVIKKLIIAVVLLFLSFMGFQIVQKLQYKEQVQQKLSSLPEFSFQTLEGSAFTKANLPKNNKAVFIATTLLLVSNESKEAIKAFAIKQNLLGKDKVICLQDSTYTFAKQFEANSIPYILAYDAQGKLLLRHKGQLRAEKLLQLLGEK